MPENIALAAMAIQRTLSVWASKELFFFFNYPLAPEKFRVKGHRISVNLRQGGKSVNSSSKLNLSVKGGKLGIYTILNPLRYSKRKHLLEAKRCVLYYILSRWRD